MGITLGCCPAAGIPTLLCIIAAAALRLNHPLIQIVSFLSYPAQLALLLPFYRAGEWLFVLESAPIAPNEVIRLLDRGATHALSRYSMTFFSGVFVWFLIAPAAAFLLFKISLPVMRRISGALEKA